MSHVQSLSQEMPSLPHKPTAMRGSEAGSLLGDERVQWILVRLDQKVSQFAAVQHRRFGGREFLRILERRRAATEELQNARLAMTWLVDNRIPYQGKWVALSGNVLLAEGDSARAVYDQVGDLEEPPFVVKVEANQERPFAGW